ncbi:MAG: hypothetical protein P8X81_07170 [Woeseiaceae bacterium]|jgi:hypothetical protein
MQITMTPLPEPAAWQRAARRRRVASLAVAALAIPAFILVVEFSSDSVPLPEFEVFLLPAQNEPEPIVEETISPRVAEPVEQQPPANEPVEQVAEDEPPVQEKPVAPHDWYAQMEIIATIFVDEQHKTYSVNPAFDEKRRQAADKFRPSRAPVTRQIWENIEVDQLGRKILVNGDCQRVIDDPSAARQDAFREFYQYIVSCSYHERKPKQLPWVEEIRERYVYLQPDEGHDNTRTDVLAELQ